MEKRAAFGRRGAAQPRLSAANSNNTFAARRAPDRFADAVEAEPAAPPMRGRDPVEAELEEWKANRKRLPLIAWRPLYFMASLCFFLASFELPDSVNDIVQWPLYALAAMSFYIGMKMRREKRAAKRAAKLEAAQNAL